VVDDVAVTLLFQTIATEAADVYVDFDWLRFADNLSNQTRHFDRIKTMTLFYLGDAAPLLPSNFCTVCALPHGVNANDGAAAPS